MADSRGFTLANSGSTHQLQATNPNAPFLSSVESNSSQTAPAPVGDPLQLNHVVDYIFIGFSISRFTTTVRTPCIIVHVSVGLNNFRINLAICFLSPTQF